MPPAKKGTPAVQKPPVPARRRVKAAQPGAAANAAATTTAIEKAAGAAAAAVSAVVAMTPGVASAVFRSAASLGQAATAVVGAVIPERPPPPAQDGLETTATALLWNTDDALSTVVTGYDTHCGSRPSHAFACADDSARAKAGVACAPSPEACDTPSADMGVGATFGLRPTLFNSRETQRHLAVLRKSRRALAQPVSLEDFFTKSLEIERVLPRKEKNSCSQTAVVFAKVRATGLPVVLKVGLTFDHEELTYRGELYDEASPATVLQDAHRTHRFEAEFYARVAKTPDLATHVVQAVAIKSFAMTDIHRLRSICRPMYKQLRRIATGFPITGITAIVTERRQKVTSLGDALARAPLTTVELRSLFFQVLFGIMLLVRNGFQHNDLHPGNILVDMDPPEKTITYQLGRRRFSVPTKYKIMLFDWDMAYCESCVQPNDDPELCASYGTCQSWNPRFDTYAFVRLAMTDVYSNNSLPWGELTTLQTFVEDLTMDGGRPQHEKFRGRMCHRPTTDEDKCAPYPPGEPQAVATPEIALRHPYFDGFRV